MSLEYNFHQAVKEWKDHSKINSIHSMSQPYLDCDAYRRIVNMGPRILPLIREEYAKSQEIGDPGICWCYVLKDIVPEFSLPVGEKDSGSAVERMTPGYIGLDIGEVQKATIKWLDQNMYKYITK